MTSIRVASAAELVDWDERTVDVRGGHVYQSRAWAEHRARAGWGADHLLFDDGFAALVLRRGWPWVGGSSAYITRGPVSAGDGPGQTAERLASIVDFLGHGEVAVVASDSEIPARTGYPAQLARIGFHPIEEIQPSRHRIALPIAGRTEDDVFAGIAKSTRQRIRKAEGEGIVVIRHDGRVAPSGVGEGFIGPKEPTELALDRFYDLLLETGERKHFAFGPRDIPHTFTVSSEEAHFLYEAERIRSKLGGWKGAPASPPAYRPVAPPTADRWPPTAGTAAAGPGLPVGGGPPDAGQRTPDADPLPF